MAVIKYKDSNNQWQPVVNYNVTVPTVVQTTGSSTTDVMSQDAVTDALDTKANTASLATVATTGSYSDLSNKPTIPAAQVNADWNASSGVAEILNKPTIPTVPTNVSSFTNDAGYLTSHQDISSKADKSYVDNNFLKSSVDVDSYLGHDYVDLGLPSGTLWATMNVGASTITGYGNYYMYGKGAAQYNSSDSNYNGTENPLDYFVDTATQVWGNYWYTPTKIQFEELIANTTVTWEPDFEGSGINGCKFTATNNKYIFLPAGGSWNSGTQYSVNNFGCYWGSTPSNPVYDLDANWATMFNCGKDVMQETPYFGVEDAFRIAGCSIRPVHDPIQSAQISMYAVTQTEKDMWIGKADSSDLTTHISDVTVHVTPSILNRIHMMENIVLCNGHAYVDLGLPSGTIWATMNVGASSETDYGYYYKYGKGTTQYNSSDSDYTGTENPLNLNVDTARQVWGGQWHMPTKAQFEELINRTTKTWEVNFNSSGINGIKFTASNGNYVFFPASGYYSQYPPVTGVGNYCRYWSSTPKNQYQAYGYDVNSSSYEGVDEPFELARLYGLSVRPVIG